MSRWCDQSIHDERHSAFSSGPLCGRSSVWNSCRGNHLGQRSRASAQTGRTYGRKRSDQSTAKHLARRGPSTYGKSPGLEVPSLALGVNETMSNNPTVIILVAGASWHYGYPTGEDLVKNVIQKAHAAGAYFRTTLNSDGGLVHRPNYITRHSADPLPNGTTGMKAEWAQAVQECEDLIDRLTAVDPLVIDYFLGQNQHWGEIGRFLIAWVLLECEAIFRLNGTNINRRGHMTPYFDNWCRFLIHKLV